MLPRRQPISKSKSRSMTECIIECSYDRTCFSVAYNRAYKQCYLYMDTVGDLLTEDGQQLLTRQSNIAVASTPDINSVKLQLLIPNFRYKSTICTEKILLTDSSCCKIIDNHFSIKVLKIALVCYKPATLYSLCGPVGKI